MNELEIKELLAGFINHLNSLGEDHFIRESEIQDFLLKKPEVVKVVTERFPTVKCLDKFGKKITDDSFVEVSALSQGNGTHKVYKKEDGQLYFKPYGLEERVSSYYRGDMILCNEDGSWK
tara:strand:- start:236 stop:595 length:360 start_codon:yes stop_codon:yes gene_type:complete